MRIEWNGKKLSKKRALFLCQKLWEWLGRTGSGDKEKWPQWVVNGGKVHEMAPFNCPCCVYDIDSRCEACPLGDYWGNGYHTCVQNPTAYHKWCSAKKKDRKKYARRIAAAAKRRYEKL